VVQQPENRCGVDRRFGVGVAVQDAVRVRQRHPPFEIREHRPDLALDPKHLSRREDIIDLARFGLLARAVGRHAILFRLVAVREPRVPHLLQSDMRPVRMLLDLRRTRVVVLLEPRVALLGKRRTSFSPAPPAHRSGSGARPPG
jgi:hypothetical protein